MDEPLAGQRETALARLRETQQRRAVVARDLELLDEDVAASVLAARRLGASWATIAEVLGVSEHTAWWRYERRKADRD